VAYLANQRVKAASLVALWIQLFSLWLIVVIVKRL